MDASQEQTDVEALRVLEPIADGFRRVSRPITRFGGGLCLRGRPVKFLHDFVAALEQSHEPRPFRPRLIPAMPHPHS